VEEDLLADLPVTEDDAGPDLNTAVAEIINNYITIPVSGNALHDKLKHLKRPGNTAFAVPEVNPELYSALSKFGKNRDRTLFRVQWTAYKANKPLFKLMSDLNKDKNFVPSRPSRKDLMRILANSVSISMASLKMISQIRREELRPEVGQYKPFLNGENFPVEKHLFGNDFQKFVKDCSAASSATLKVAKTKNGAWARKGRFTQRPFQRPYNYNRAAFPRNQPNNTARNQTQKR